MKILISLYITGTLFWSHITIAQVETTYYRDAKPIIDGSCTSCHSEEAVAFPLTSYQEVYDLRFAVQNAVESGRMPIWLPAPGHRPYLNDLSLTQEEQATLTAWFTAGFPEGNPADAREVPPRVQDIEPDMIIPLLPNNGSYLPDQNNRDDYRCFITAWPLSTIKYLVGFQSKPGNLRVAHHSLAFLIQPELAPAVLYLAEQEPGPGYKCFGGPYPDRIAEEAVREDIENRFPGSIERMNENQDSVGGWAPGTGGRLMPGNSGFKILPGSLFVVQMHYYSAYAPGEADQGTESWLKLADSVPDEGAPFAITDSNWLRPIATNTMVIPPQSSRSFQARTNALSIFERYEDLRSSSNPYSTMTIYSANLHMHDFGSSAITYLERGGQRQVMLEIPAWDLNWQTNFDFAEPIVLTRAEAAQTDIVVECTIFNSTNNTVYGGFGSDDEMCFNFGYSVLR